MQKYRKAHNHAHKTWENRRLESAAGAEILVQFLYVNRHKISERHVAHDVLNDVVRVGNLQMRENTVEHQHGASYARNRHLLAVGPGDHQFPGRKQQRRSLRRIHPDSNRRKSLLVVRAAVVFFPCTPQP